MLDYYAIVCSGHNLFRPTLPLPALTMHTHLRNGGDNVADINSLSEKVLLVSRGRFQKMETDLSCPQPPVGGGILFHDTKRVLINSLCARLSAHLLTEARPGKLLPPSIPHVLSDCCFHYCICFPPPHPPNPLCVSPAPKSAESQKRGRIGISAGRLDLRLAACLRLH